LKAERKTNNEYENVRDSNTGLLWIPYGSHQGQSKSEHLYRAKPNELSKWSSAVYPQCTNKMIIKKGEICI
jgi:hypothetical protein